MLFPSQALWQQPAIVAAKARPTTFTYVTVEVEPHNASRTPNTKEIL